MANPRTGRRGPDTNKRMEERSVGVYVRYGRQGNPFEERLIM